MVGRDRAASCGDRQSEKHSRRSLGMVMAEAEELTGITARENSSVP